MNVVKKSWMAALAMMFLCFSCQRERVYDLSDYGLKPDSGENASPLIAKALQAIAAETKGNTVTILLPKGRYDFYPDGASEREYYISNHDQDNPKMVGLSFEQMQNMVFDGQGSEFIFHGRMLPVSLVGSDNCTLKNFSIDFENPHISQVKILKNDTVNGLITYEVAPWVQYEIRDSNFVAKGEGWEHIPRSGIAFEGATKRLVYTTSDIAVATRRVKEIAPRQIEATWRNKKLIPGTVVAMRGWGRTTPGVFLYHDTDTKLENIQVHYAEGMGLLAQLCQNITLNKFNVCLKGEDDARCFTTQADATHFSGCKGVINSCDGLYEGMMDDAINVHGTYLKVIRRIDDRTLVGRYMHDQSWGFRWGEPGDSVQFIRANTMELTGNVNRIDSIRPYDRATEKGAREFLITFRNPIANEISENGAYGIENLTWTPEVLFARNTIRNNRARGALFSTPRRTTVEDNFFDHTSGTAILLCGDCNGWYETGACRDVLIRRNRFVNALTSLYQFTNAVISIYPDIPELDKQQQYFHGGKGKGIVIEDNEFDMFDAPLLYAKSVDGLWFRRNIIRKNTAYPPFHFNKDMFWLERVTNVHLSE